MDAIEVYHNFGTVFAPVLDMQLVEVLARKTALKESEKLRLRRLGERTGMWKRMKRDPELFAGVHVVTGMQACVERRLPQVIVHKDEKVKKLIFSEENLTLQRPFLRILRDYSAADIRLLGHIFNNFSDSHQPFIPLEEAATIQTILDLSLRYVTRNGLTARETGGKKESFRVGFLLLLDALTTPLASLIKCTTCDALLPLSGFQCKIYNANANARRLRREQCRICVCGEEIRKIRKKKGKTLVSLPSSWVALETST